MTIQYLSDLHLEYADNEAWLRKRQIRVAGDVLVAAGDMFYLDDSSLGSNFFCEWAADNFEQVLIVPGNHEYYGGCDVMGAGHSWQYKIKSNVGYYQNNTVRIGDTDFILSTLWSYIPPDRQSITEFFLNDFHRIRYRGRLLTPEDFNREHVRCKAYIRRAVAGSIGAPPRGGHASCAHAAVFAQKVHAHPRRTAGECLRDRYDPLHFRRADRLLDLRAFAFEHRCRHRRY